MHRRTLLRALVAALAAVFLVLPGGPASSHPGHAHPPHPAPAPTGGCTAPAWAWTIGTHNVLHGTATFTPFASIIGWQEVDSTGSWSRLRRQLGTAYRHYIPTNRSAAAVPVSWRVASFAFVSARSVKTHDGRAGVTPARWISIVHLRRRATGQRVIVVNTHFISEAFKAGSSYRTWRLARWYEHLAKLRGVLDHLRYRFPHATIFLVGDFNHHDYLDFSAEHVYPLKAGTSTPIDQLYAGVPGRGACVEELSTMGSDHNRWRAKAWIG